MEPSTVEQQIANFRTVGHLMNYAATLGIQDWPIVRARKAELEAIQQPSERDDLDYILMELSTPPRAQSLDDLEEALDLSCVKKQVTSDDLDYILMESSTLPPAQSLADLEEALDLSCVKKQVTSGPDWDDDFYDEYDDDDDDDDNDDDSDGDGSLDNQARSAISDFNDFNIDDYELSEPEIEPEPASEAENELPSLFECAARVTAKHVSCMELQRNIPPLDEPMLKRVAFHAFPTDNLQVKAFANLSLRDNSDWKQGEEMADEGCVQYMIQVGFMVTAAVTIDTMRNMRLCDLRHPEVRETRNVSITFEKQCITSSSCESCPKCWCPHVIAAAIHRIKHAHEIAIHAPVTETLSTLSREQLQKLMQYTIDEDPRYILETVFKRIDTIRDKRSDINTTAGAPDQTFGLEGKFTWELSLDAMMDNFMSDWLEIEDDFIVSYEEPVIQQSVYYRQYLQKVVDLAVSGEIEAAGKVLIAIVNSTLACIPDTGPLSRKFAHIVHVLEKLCCHYIVSFSGPSRQDVIIACLHSNRKGILTSAYSKWADAPPPSTMFHNSASDVEVRCGKPAEIFYEPLCAALLDDANQAYHDMINGNVELATSQYDEALPVMMLRFAALRRWSGTDGTCIDTGKKLCRLGIVLLKKLLQSTYKHSALSYQEDMTLEAIAKRSKKRSAAKDRMETKHEPWKKKRRYLEQTSGSSAEWTDASNEDNAQIGNTASARRPASRRVETLSMLHVANNKSTSQYDTIPVPVETLAYCLQHVCYYIYTTVLGAFLENGSSENNEILAVATLRTLELARLRSYWHPPTVISVEEHQWLEKMEKQIGDSYYMKKRQLSSRVNALHRLHMNVLTWDNKKSDHPPAVELIHLLVKCAGSKQKAAMALTISTICHSPSAPEAFTIPYKCNTIVDRFGDIFRLFLSRMDKVTTDQIQEKLLLKVLTHYENVVDGMAVFAIIAVLVDYPDKLLLHEAIQVAATKLLLHSIKLHKLNNMDDANSFIIPSYCTRMCDVMISLRNTLGAKFFEICHSYFEDLVKLFRSNHSMNFVAAMDTGQFGDNLSEDLANGLFTFLEAKHPHNLESCDILVALEADGVNYKTALQIIKDNSDNFSSTALLQIAKKGHEMSPPSEGVVFTNDVCDLIRRALGNIRVQNATAVGSLNNTDVQNAAACGSVDNTCVQNAATLGYNAVFGTSYLPAGLRWVFEAFTVKTSTQSFTQSEQFGDISTLIVEAFPRDVDTWIKLCMKVIASESLLEVCRDKIGPEIDNIYRMAFAELQYGNRVYGKLIRKLKSVLDVYNKFVRNGSSAFTNLVKSIRDANRKKKKLLKMLADAFPVDMQS